MAAITRGATLSSNSRTVTGTDASVSHTVDANTSLLVVTTMFEAGETVSGTPQWSLGGRLLSATATWVRLDQEILLGTGGNYALMCRVTGATGDSMETHALTAGLSGYVREVTTTGAFIKTPLTQGLWAIGVVGAVTKPFRIAEMKRDNDDNMRIGAIEYSENVFSAEGTEPWDEITWTWDSPATPIPDHIQDLTLRVESDYYAGLIIDWNPPDSGRTYKGADFYTKGVTGEDWQFWQSADRPPVRYTPIRINKEYYFRGVSFNEDHAIANFNDAPSAYIKISATAFETGDTYRVYEPPIITGLTIG